MGFDPLSIVAEVAIAQALVDIGVGIEAAYATASVAAVAAPYALAAGAIGGSIALSAALTPEVKPAKAPRQMNAYEGGPRVHVIGKMRRPAQVIWTRSKGSYDLHRIGVLCMGPIDGIEEFRVSGRRVAVDSGTVSTEPFRQNVEITTRSGAASQAVFAATNSAFPSHWLTTARGDGLAMVEWVSTSPGYDSPNHAEIFSAGYPTVDAVVRGAPPFDPRLGSDPTNDAHRAWTDNAAIQILDRMVSSRLRGGWGQPVTRWDLDDLMAIAIPWCDGWETLKSGATERRSRLWGGQDCGPGVKLVDTLKALILSSGLDIVRTQRGKLTLRPILDAPDPTAVIPWSAILPGVTVDGGPVTFDRPNRAVVTYLEPDRDYDTVQLDTSATAWASVDGEIARNGEHTAPIALEFCPSPGQASRIARNVFAMRRARRAVYPLTMAGLVANGHAEVAVVDEDIGETVPIRIDSVDNDLAARTVTVGGVVKPTLAPYDPQTDEAAPPAARREVPDSSSPASPNIQDMAIVATGYGSTRTWALRVKFSFTGGSLYSDDQQVIFRRSSDQGRSWTAWESAPRLPSAQSSPVVVQTGNFASLDLVAVAVSSSRIDTHDVSGWEEDEIAYAPLAYQLPAPTTVVTDNGDGTSTIVISGDLRTSWYVVTRSVTFPSASTTQIAAGDSTSVGGYSVTASNSATIAIYAYDSEGRAAPVVTVAI